MYLIILTNYNVDTYDTNCAFSPAIYKNNDLHSVSMETVWWRLDPAGDIIQVRSSDLEVSGSEKPWGYSTPS